MQRQPISFLLGIFLLFSLPSGIAAQVIRVGYPSLATGFAASWVTADKGIRKKHGFEVELIYLRSGSRTVAALTVVASTLFSAGTWRPCSRHRRT